MDFIFIIIILIMSVVIHEVAHGYAALYLGDPTAKYQGRLTLNPLKHLDPIGSVLVPLIGYFFGGFILGWAKPVPFNPYNLNPETRGLPARSGEALVALVGPLSNILLALIFGLIIRFMGNSGALGESFLGLAGSLVLINITLAVFNLVPIPPLDGSKILFAVLPYKWHGFLQSFERLGMVAVLIFVFFIWGFLSPVVGYLFSILTGLSL